MFAMVGALVLLALTLVLVGGCTTMPPEVKVFSASPTSGYAPLTVTFSAELVCADSWFWDFGGTGTSTEEDPVHIFQNPGTYAVVLTATNKGPCGVTETTKKTLTITVGEKPIVRIVSINIDLNPVCTNIPTRVSAVVEHNYPITYSWTSSDGHADSAASTTFTFGKSGTKTIGLTVTTVKDGKETVAYKTATLVVRDCCDPCPDDPCNPCESAVLDRLEPERACVPVYDNDGLDIVALFKGWPCLSPCSVFDTQSVGIQGIVPCPQKPDCGCGCGKTKISWSFKHDCCGGDSPVLGEDFEIVGVPWGEFGQYIRVRFFLSGEWTVTASINGESKHGHYMATVQ